VTSSHARPLWPHANRGASSAPEWLPKLAQGIAQRARDSLRGHLDITYAEPRRGAYACEPTSDRGWLAHHDAGVAWCIVDTRSQAALLALVIGGQGAERETAIERAIVSEAMERLLSVEDFRQTRWAESGIDRPAGDRIWRCNVEVASRSGRCAILQLFALPADRDPAREAISPCISQSDIGHVNITLRAELRRVRSPLAQILAWAPGTVVALRSRSLSHVNLLVQDSVIATGRVGSVATHADARSRAIEIERVAGTPAA
jgi:flagellar motor switch/type III secretory pathway protein FliN